MTKEEIEEAVKLAKAIRHNRVRPPFTDAVVCVCAACKIAKAVLALSERLERAKKVIEIVSSSLFSTEDHKDHRRLREALAETEEKP